MAEQQKRDSSALMEALRAFSVLSGAGFYIAAVLGPFIFLGHCTDDFFGTGHTFTVIGILLGFPAAIYALYRQLKHYKIV
mgnify:CR=1 FL=1